MLVVRAWATGCQSKTDVANVVRSASGRCALRVKWTVFSNRCPPLLVLSQISSLAGVSGEARGWFAGAKRREAPHP